jgi:hypothetical protein
MTASVNLMEDPIFLRFNKVYGIYVPPMVAKFPPALAAQILATGAAEIYTKAPPAEVQKGPLPKRSKSVTTKG